MSKAVVVGDLNVGKTCLINRCVGLEEAWTTVVVYLKSYVIDLWVICGSNKI